MKQASELRSRSFIAMTATQFLGAFNDNAFKTLILLLAADLGRTRGGGIYTALIGGLFALPFVLFSGFAGLLADRFSKRRIIILAKVGEVVVMLFGAVAFALASMPLLCAAVFLMGTQSAFFGPAKYGVLPELLDDRELARGNGVILMTTFLSIILGMAVAGNLRDRFGDELLAPAAFYILVALVGTMTACAIRRLPPSDPDLALDRRMLGDLWPTMKMIARDRGFRLVILANSYFWFMGGVVQLSLPAYGRHLMNLDNSGTSYLLVSLSGGMAGGSILGGLLSRGRINFNLCHWGLAGMIASLALLVGAHASPTAAHATLILLGLSGGLFGLPLQTYVQAHADPEQRGRVVAAANFVNWVFIFLSAAFFAGADALAGNAGVPGILAALTLLTVPLTVPGLRRLAREQRALRKNL